MVKPNISRNRLKNISLLNDELTPTNPSTINIDLIVLPSSQPRRYFDEEQLNQLAESIKKHGIIEPLVVRSMDDGKYELITGERRYRSAKIAGLNDIPVAIRELTDTQARHITLIENLQRVDLNPIEETEGILELLALELNQSVDKVISLLYQMNNESKKESNQNVLVKPEIKNVFDSLGLITWQSFVTTRLPLLSLPPDILEILRQGKIAYTKAIALSKVKDEEVRKDITKEALEQKLSLRDLKLLIAEVTANTVKEAEKEVKSIENSITSTAKQLNKVKLWKSNPQKWKRVERLITEINMLLVEEE